MLLELATLAKEAELNCCSEKSLSRDSESGVRDPLLLLLWRGEELELLLVSFFLLKADKMEILVRESNGALLEAKVA